MNIIDCPSPNFNDRRAPFDARGPRMIVIHYTDMASVESALDRMCDSQAEVSAHYLVTSDGAIYRLVEEVNRAWHAGQGSWHVDGVLEHDLNSASIGIELDYPGHSNAIGGVLSPFPPEQIEALVELCRAIMQQWNIPARNVIGHSDLAPGRKIDPGPMFPWKQLAAKGIGQWVDNPAVILSNPDVQEQQERLVAIGYDVPQDGIMDQRTATVLGAFKLHYGN